MAAPNPTTAPLILDGAIPQGLQDYVFMPSVANLVAGATLAEINAGTNYKRQLAMFDGFQPEGSTVDFPNAGQRTIPNIPGTFSYGTGTVGFNLSKSVADARTVFVDGTDGVSAPTAGYWGLFYTGLGNAGGKYKIFAATVTSANVSTDLNAPLTLATTWALQAASGFLTIPTS